MALTKREQEILDLVRGEPLIAAAEIARQLGSTRAAVNVHLSNLGKKGAILGRGYIVQPERAAVVIGGANVDIKARSLAKATMGTSNPGTGRTSSGGVGRNIAETLARLGTTTHLIAAVGHDAMGERLIDDTRAAGVRLEHLHRTSLPTGTYIALLDADGELVLAISDMAATDALAPDHIDAARELIASARLLVLDGNLASATLSFALDHAQTAGVRTVIDPVSVPKAVRLIELLTPDRPLFALTPNLGELEAIAGQTVADDHQLLAAVATLHERGVLHVWVRLGQRGSLLSSADDGHTFIPALPATVHDVTGAGDAMLGAFAHALLTGHDPADAARYGHAAAALTIASEHTVRPDLTPRLIEDQLTQIHSN